MSEMSEEALTYLRFSEATGICGLSVSLESEGESLVEGYAE